jgi:hypothetical protein
MKRIFLAVAGLCIVQTPAAAQSGIVDQLLSQVGRQNADRENLDQEQQRRETQRNAPARRQKVPEDGRILSATTKWGTCYTAQGQAYKCAMQRGTDGTPATNELPPNAQYPYWHTKQLCRGGDGSKKPCRIYR